MKTIKIVLLALILSATTFAGIQPNSAHADWQPEVLASSALVRFEAMPVAYDAETNKYKYKFSWLMPANRTYSFKIDGKIYMNAKQNGTVETPLWFSPDITYTIQIHPAANGGGTMLAEGRFTAPSVTVPAKALTEDEEYEVIGTYLAYAPDMPRKTVKSKVDAEAIISTLYATEHHTVIYESFELLSSESQEMLRKTPLFVKLMDSAPNETLGQQPKNIKVKVFSGKEYATLKYKIKNNVTKKNDSVEIVFIKENGQWKFDLVQMLKEEIID